MKYEASSGTPTKTRTGSVCSRTNKRPAARAGTGLQVVARADVALGDHAVVGGFDLAVFDLNPCLSFLGLGDLKLGLG